MKEIEESILQLLCIWERRCYPANAEFIAEVAKVLEEKGNPKLSKVFLEISEF